MNVKYHILLGIPFSALLYFFFPELNLLSILIVFSSSFLIDADHYFYYLYKKRNLNPFKAYQWYKKNTIKFHSLIKEQQRKTYLGIYFFHGIESLIILFLLGNYFSPFFIFVLLGFLFHIIIDLVYEKILGKRLDKFSLIYNCIIFRKLTFIERI